MLLPIPPQLSVSRAVQYLKDRSSHKLLSEFAALRLIEQRDRRVAGAAHEHPHRIA
jgi:hypothetical protein